jgi:hypothetical protein
MRCSLNRHVLMRYMSCVVCPPPEEQLWHRHKGSPSPVSCVAAALPRPGVYCGTSRATTLPTCPPPTPMLLISEDCRLVLSMDLCDDVNYSVTSDRHATRYLHGYA